MTRPAQAVAAAQAVIADAHATAAALAAWEATRSATMAVQPPRVQNATSEFVGRAEKAARTGTAYEATLSPDRAYGQMAGIAATAKYAAAAANATRYAADAARKAGAQRAASRAEHAAEVAAWWADMAQDRAEHSTFAPYTVLRTARCARRAAAAARYAARASGPGVLAPPRQPAIPTCPRRSAGGRCASDPASTRRGSWWPSPLAAAAAERRRLPAAAGCWPLAAWSCCSPIRYR